MVACISSGVFCSLVSADVVVVLECRWFREFPKQNRLLCVILITLFLLSVWTSVCVCVCVCVNLASMYL